MIRALFFLLKVAVIAAIAVWVADLEGAVRFAWTDSAGSDIAVNIHLGLFLLVALAVMLLALVLFRIIKGTADFPKTLARYKQQRNKDKGLRALTLGLTAVAAGDTKAAVYQAVRAQRLLPEENGLSLLLKAQAARLDGREDEANDNFIRLLENKDASFLGMRGLLQAALDRKDYGSALTIAREALKLHPKQPWILKITYDLEIKLRELDSALKTLYRAEKQRAISKEKAQSDRIAMLLYKADADVTEGNMHAARLKLEKAYGYDPVFIPTVIRLARHYLQHGKRRKAVSLIEKAWKVNTHPDLVPLWASAMPKSKGEKSLEQLKWFERLLSLNTASSQGQLAVAKAAMESGLWGEARNYLKNAEHIRPSKKLYRLYALLEEKTTKDSSAVQEYLQRAADAPPEKCWVCHETGHVYDSWSAYAEPGGRFNSIRWDFPFVEDDEVLLIHEDVGTEDSSEPKTILEIPKVR